MKSIHKQKGFTLVEMIVSLGLFTIIMFIATSAFLSIVNTDRKARSVRIAADNLNIALEDMSRRIKTGSIYNCGGGVGTNDCSGIPGSTFAFNDDSTASSRVTYKLVTGSGAVPVGCGAEFSSSQGCILRSDNLVTSPEINITDLKFLVSGSDNLTSGDKKQPMVTIVIDGSLGAGVASSTFKIQTTITQRAYDNQ